MADPIREHLLAQLRSRFRCPACHSAITWEGGSGDIPCGFCAARYPVLPSGVPVLLVSAQRARFAAILEDDSGGRRMVAEYRRFGTCGSEASTFARLR